MSSIFVLTIYHNDYDQHGPTVEAVFNKEPTPSAVIAALSASGGMAAGLGDVEYKTLEELREVFRSEDYQRRHNHDDVCIEEWPLTIIADD